MQWDEGKDNFAKDPPNATSSVLGGDGSKVADAVVTVKAPKLQGGDLTFEVAVLEGSLHGASGPAARFIDPFALADSTAGSEAFTVVSAMSVTPMSATPMSAVSMAGTVELEEVAYWPAILG